MFDRQHHTLFEVRSVLLFAALTMGSTSALMAQSSTMPAAASSDQQISAAFANADKDANGSLSREEARSLPAVAESFAQIDANGDGAISLAEFTAAMKDPKS
ncbi:EF-hand domain-containing protein [Hydrogenophaga sp.]|jgi:Ca2+-binding EF-hand superfamily protein|uniref:EF-hand domain-containing protein n=1 Tax=Hydrogenophaga sp. TaxID=1904254 RepID=UPI0027196381|nr:EF-hand domain-containing protein [Hydrogenophaga sp.]MDO9251883.1 EF-hand domain-containing protein [Hydrogenophaga sp.]MDP3325037.1 EF-hand domain-containing protein [Hydrogenophaga sp.]MDP3885190.1 EF-hand domain-containing protein [Hydrogenophaga sp.]